MFCSTYDNSENYYHLKLKRTHRTIRTSHFQILTGNSEFFSVSRVFWPHVLRINLTSLLCRWLFSSSLIYFPSVSFTQGWVGPSGSKREPRNYCLRMPKILLFPFPTSPPDKTGEGPYLEVHYRDIGKGKKSSETDLARHKLTWGVSNLCLCRCKLSCTLSLNEPDFVILSS